MKRRRWFLLVACLLLVGSVVWLGAPLGRRPHWPRRAFCFRYRASIANLPSTGTVRIWVPLAKTRDNQRVIARRIEAPLPYTLEQEPVFGNEMLYLHLAAPIPEHVEILVDYEVVVQGGRRLGAGHPAASGDAFASEHERELALRDEPFMVVNDGIRRLALEAASGQTTQLGRARALYEYVITRMRYDKTAPGWGQGDTMRACVIGKGNCTDFHSLFISLGRSIGIPARFVIGAPVPEGPGGGIPGYHCWAEFYHPEYGWVPVDASEAGKHPELRDYYFGSLDPNRVLISVGRNLRLVPAQDGPAVNIFVYPYVEINGKPSGKVETRFEYSELDRRRRGRQEGT